MKTGDFMYTILSIICLAAEIWAVWANVGMKYFILIHIIAAATLFAARRTLKGVRKDSLESLIIIMMPVGGLFVHVAVEICYKFLRIDENAVAEYEDYIKYKELITLHKDIDVQKEINILSLGDRLMHSSSEEKKSAIMSLNTNDIEVKTGVLRKALLDKDPEVVHYAASTLSFIHDRYENKLSDMENEYARRSTTSKLYELISEYKKYLSLGLVDELSRTAHEKKYVRFLKELESRSGGEFDTGIMIAREYTEYGNIEGALGILQKLRSKHADRHEVYIEYMHVCYKKRDFKSIMRTAKKVKEMDIKIPDKEMKMVDFWT